MAKKFKKLLKTEGLRKAFKEGYKQGVIDSKVYKYIHDHDEMEVYAWEDFEEEFLNKDEPS